MKSRRRFTWPCLVVLLLSLIGCSNQNTVGKSGVVALYSDQGCWDKSITAATKMFLWMDYSVASVDADYLNDVGLHNFRVLCVPGGDMYQYSQDISARGKGNIKDFVRDITGYVDYSQSLLLLLGIIRIINNHPSIR